MADEVELKFRLVGGAEALDAFAKVAGVSVSQPARQVNHFFDTTDGALRQAKCILRLREEDGAFFLTAKGPQRRSDGHLSSTAEAEVRLSTEEGRGVLEGTRHPLDTLAVARGEDSLIGDIRALVGTKPLLRVGAFINERCRAKTRLECEPAIEVTLELDRTQFPGGVIHHEVEVELPVGSDPASAERALLALFERAGVSPSVAPSKSKRFFSALEGKHID